MRLMRKQSKQRSREADNCDCIPCKSCTDKEEIKEEISYIVEHIIEETFEEYIYDIMEEVLSNAEL